ncbi:MAG: hypothetical protein H6738_24565 [Alphaproteobacteria bacterium]|nr:hypothetical protein [Alphaproteobacteria bacterium]
MFMVPDPTVQYPPYAPVRVYADAEPDDDELRMMGPVGRVWGPVLEMRGRSAWLGYVWTSDAAVVPPVP